MGANGQALAVRESAAPIMAANDGHTCFSEAFAAAQGEMRAAEKNCVNPHFKSRYADLASIIDATKPLARHGIARVQTTEIRDSQLVLVTRLLFGGGIGAESVFPLPAIADPQKMGAALTYFKRFALSMVCGIAADDDDDGNTAASAQVKATPREVREQPRRVETTVIRAESSPEKAAPKPTTVEDQETDVTEALLASDLLNQIRNATNADELKAVGKEIAKHKLSDRYRVPLRQHYADAEKALAKPANPEDDGR